MLLINRQILLRIELLAIAFKLKFLYSQLKMQKSALRKMVGGRLMIIEKDPALKLINKYFINLFI